MKKMLTVVLAAAMTASLVACGGQKTEEKAETTAATDAVAETEAAGADQTEAATEAAAPAEGGLKVALLMSGAANDGGWNQTAYEGTLKACEKYGYELTYSENVQVADIAAVFTDYAQNGYDVVIGHGYEFGDPALEAAELYPDCKFICTESDAAAENVASYVMACEQTAYVEGVIAAKMTQSNIVGAIGPLPGDSLVKILNGFEDGAKSVNPDITFKGAWTNSFVDTQLAQEAAQAMIDDGADVIKHCANACGNGAMAAAVEANIWCQGDSYDQSFLAPENILDSALYNLEVVLDIALGSIADGSFKGEIYNLGMADNAVAVLFSDNLPEDIKAEAQAVVDQIISGELEVVRDYTMRQ